MRAEELIRTLRELKALRVEAIGHAVSVHVPAIADTVRLNARNVDRWRAVSSPTGEQAIQLLVLDGALEETLIFTDTDVVFAPVDAAGLLDSPLEFTVDDAPDMVAYSEMERDARAPALACDQPGEVNLDQLAGGLLQLRCSILGAARLGLRPSRATALWQQTWRAFEGDVPLPPFRPDADWDRLVNAAR